jgi:hypothetical protein
MRAPIVRHFGDALDRSAEHERAEIDGREHQDQSDGAQQDQQRRAHVAGHGVPQRLNVNRLPPVIRFRQFFAHRRRQFAELARRRVGRHAWSEAGERLGECGLEVLSRGIPRQCRPQIVTAREDVEVRRHDADDRVWLAVELDAATDHVRVGIEPAAPQLVGEYRHARCAGTRVAWFNGAAERRTPAQCLEDVVGHSSAGDFDRLAALRDQAHHPPGRDGGDLIEAARAVSPERDLLVRYEVVGPERDQPIRLGERQRAKQDATHH